MLYGRPRAKVPSDGQGSRWPRKASQDPFGTWCALLSAIYDLAVRGYAHLLVETANTADPLHDPLDLEIATMARRSGLHSDLLERILEAVGASVGTRDKRGAVLGDNTFSRW